MSRFARAIALFVAILALGCTAFAAGAPTTQSLTPRPPMGWNSWNVYMSRVDEAAILATARAMAEKYKPYGYDILVVDGGWLGPMDEYGRLQVNSRAFPRGMKAVAADVHALGLKIGVHMMRGIPRLAYQRNLPVHGTEYRAQDIGDPTSICPWSHSHYGINMDKPGAQAYYDDWIALLASYDVDFIKADDLVPHPREIKAIADAIAKTGRPIVLSLSPGDVWKDEDLAAYRLAGLVRITRDIHDRPGDIETSFDNWLRFSRLIDDPANPGVWPDLDMIPFGRMLFGMSGGGARRGRGRAGTGPASQLAAAPATLAVAPAVTRPFGRLTTYNAAQKRTFITQRALAASPLFISGSLLDMEQAEVDLLTNRQMIACNQNGVVGRRVSAADGIEIWRTPRRMQPNEGWIGVFNRSTEAKALKLTPQQLGLDPAVGYTLLDTWQPKHLALINDAVEIDLAADDVCFIKYEPAKR